MSDQGFPRPGAASPPPPPPQQQQSWEDDGQQAAPSPYFGPGAIYQPPNDDEEWDGSQPPPPTSQSQQQGGLPQQPQSQQSQQFQQPEQSDRADGPSHWGPPSDEPSTDHLSQQEAAFTVESLPRTLVHQLSPQMQEMAMLLLAAIVDDECSEVIINGPTEVMQKAKGRRFHIPMIQFDSSESYHAALNQYVLPYTDTDERIGDKKNVLIEGQLEIPSEDPNVPPVLARVHVLAPPLVQHAKVTIAKKARWEYDLDAIVGTGAMTQGMADFVKAAARGRLNIVISGVTGAGKTTLLQAITHYYDQNDRIVVVEDTPELRLPLADVVHLLADVYKPGRRPEDQITVEWLVRQAQRMRMDRILVGEVRGAEMAEFLIAANSGADGSATTVHADNPRRALDKMLALATKSPTAASEMTLRREIAATVDLIVQASLVDGQHKITAIEEVSTTIRQDTGVIATQTLFVYDRASDQHVAKTAPSDDLQQMLRNRGVPIDPMWFGRSR